VLVRQVEESLNIRISPSAFQIRYGGCKGVVSVWPHLEDDQLHVRKSMEKFKSDHHELEVVQYTTPGNLSLSQLWTSSSLSVVFHVTLLS